MDQLCHGRAFPGRRHGVAVPAMSLAGRHRYLSPFRGQDHHLPFHRRKLIALPAIFPDVGVIHVHEADRFGNCRIRGTTVADFDLARASKKLIITCERLIANEEIRQDPSRTIIPFYCVDAVCEVPYGSYPGNMPYEYFSDENHFRQWLDAEKSMAAFQEFLQKYIFGVRDFVEYLQLCGGLPRMQELRRQELLLD